MKELSVAIDACKKAGDIIMRYFGNVSYTLKGKGNPVTVADIKSQEMIVSMIKKEYPKDSIVSEENFNDLENVSRLWLIDPLDGTVNFSHSFNHFSVSVAFLKDGNVVVGVVYDPVKNELFWACRGKGAFLNGRRIKVSCVNKLGDSLLATGFPYDRSERPEFYCRFYSEFLRVSHDVRRCGVASLDMAYVACGRLDGYWEFNLKPWDVAAGKIIVEEAGGRVSDFEGRRWEKRRGLFLTSKRIIPYLKWGSQTLATNSKIHSQMLKVIEKVRGMKKAKG